VNFVRFQWTFILGLFFSLVVAIFAVVNVESVSVNYLFGYANIPLILIILGSALVGGLVVGLFGVIRQYRLQRRVKMLEKELGKVKLPIEDEKGNDS
jgi:lipopolysaccharide assembly protein A